MLRCGLLGGRLGHSYSPQIHGLLGDYTYKLYEKTPEELEKFLNSRDFDGLNVTIPYKQAVIPYCAALSPRAKEIGSVNTLVRRRDGSLYGDNTDYDGFCYLVRRSGINVAGKKCLVLGSGGTSRTVCTALRDLGGKPIVISRQGENNYENLEKHWDAGIIVNTTPVGMYPKVGESPVDLQAFPHLKGVLDVIFNPARTALLLSAESLGIPTGNGLPMLVAQAKRAAELFLDTSIADEKIEQIHHTIRNQEENIILIGMPGCGKSAVGQALAQRLGRRFIDADRRLVEKAGKTIPEIFAESGEAVFRRLETETLQELGQQSGLVLATGGGCVTRPENYSLLHQNGQIFWLQRSLEKLPKEGRPLSQSMELSQMLEARRDSYARFADSTVNNDGPLSAAVQEILEKLEGAL